MRREAWRFQAEPVDAGDAHRIVIGVEDLIARCVEVAGRDVAGLAGIAFRYLHVADADAWDHRRWRRRRSRWLVHAVVLEDFVGRFRDVASGVGGEAERL